ncbi:MAG: hypothetical protein M9907_05430 [Burkholderiaceae bacterium]|nr:hypothetical protein [Burkholderiaceae bacterium]
MPSNLPLDVVIVEVVRHTPVWAWGILAAIVVLGALQMRDHATSRLRLLAMPLGMGGYSLWAAAAAFGVQAPVLLAWTAGLSIALASNARAGRPGPARADGDGGFALPGSPLPLLLMLAVFVLRYAVAVSLVLHPQWRVEAGFALPASVAGGFLSGLFAARARRILGTPIAGPRAASA